MKMLASDYTQLTQALDAVKPTLDKAWLEYQAANLSPMRYRWDAVRFAKVDVCKYYSYLNDTHIDTALRTYFKHSK